ncbi:MAG: MerR family transcriptional regulator [Coriobacteriia bacterium]|nr:MerR family transcriptional regulator [Coriobacteriia bacterium]
MTENDLKPSKRPEKAPDSFVSLPDSPRPIDIGLDHLLPISQFSRSTGIARSALIYYDETGVFHPARRDPKNNYRYYRPDQIITANLISVLAELNIPLRQIKKLSTQRSAADMIALFDEHHDTLEEHIRHLEQSVQLIEVFRDLLNMGKDINESEIAVKTIPRWDIAIGPECEPFVEAGNFYQPFLDFYAWAQAQGLSISFPVGGHFKTFEAFCDHPGEPNNFFLLFSTRPDPDDTIKVLTAYSRGFYGQPGDIAVRMARALKKKRLTPAGPVICAYIEDEISTVDPSRYLMQATMRVQ